MLARSATRTLVATTVEYGGRGSSGIGSAVIPAHLVHDMLDQ